MNANDARLWQSAIVKLEAGNVQVLTDAEREVVLFYGGPHWLQPVKSDSKVANANQATKRLGPLHTKSGDRPMTYPELLEYVEAYYRRPA